MTLLHFCLQKYQIKHIRAMLFICNCRNRLVNKNNANILFYSLIFSQMERQYIHGGISIQSMYFLGGLIPILNKKNSGRLGIGKCL